MSKDAFSPKFFKRVLARTPLGHALEAGPLTFDVNFARMRTSPSGGLVPMPLPEEELEAAVRALAWDVCTLKGVDRSIGEVSQARADVLVCWCADVLMC